jgi:hypothetical protein
MFNLLKFFREQILRKTSNEDRWREYDMLQHMRSTLDDVATRENIAHENIAKKYEKPGEIPLEIYMDLLDDEMERLYKEDEAEELKRKSLLRHIKTLRTKEEIKEAINSGAKVLKQKVKPSKEIWAMDYHIKDLNTGEITKEAYTFGNLVIGDRDDKEIVKVVEYYPYTFPSKDAAYLLPDDLVAGERVIIDDLIEDIVGESHSYGQYRLDSAEAIWDGKKFIIDRQSYDVEVTFG